MFTIFTIPKPFKGHNKIIQRNAIKSWMQLKPKCEIILFGNDEGVAETAVEFNIKHIPDVENNEFGTPLLSSVFSIAQKEAQYNILMYINADIIIMPDLINVINQLSKREFLICGRRWDLDIKEEIDFDNHTWSSGLVNKVRNQGSLHGFSGIDYFIFPRNVIQMPAFAVGRPVWDNWLIYNVRSRCIPVIDATEAITAIHQNHDYSHSKFGEKKRVGGPEQKRNMKIAGGYTCAMTLRDADWELDQNGIKRSKLHRRIFSNLSMFYPCRVLLSIKRQLQEYIDFNVYRP